jgi:glyceraldehyde 3-phosphate dehydrogenase
MGHKRPDLEFAVICDDADPRSLVYLLNNSTIEGPFHGEAKLNGNYIECHGQRARILSESEPGHIPWDAFGVDVVMECTGRNRTRAALQPHIDAGAKSVLLSTPPEDEIDGIFVRGINCDSITGSEKIISCGSSSVHALALICKILDEAAVIEAASMTTVHAYTGDQTLSDNARPGQRWSRSAAQNIIPNTTWAPDVVQKVLPALKGKIDGLALNVPVPAGSNIDLVAKLVKPLGIEEINAAVLAASEGAMKGLVRYTDEPIVSSDAIGDNHSVVFDSTATIAMGNGLTKTLGWFDNGWAYAARMLETALKLTERQGGAS